MSRILVTGGAGFVGSHVVRHLLTHTQHQLILPVSFRHRGDGARLRVATEDHPDWWNRITVIYHDLRAPFSETELCQIGEVETIINLASESHVDRSISEPEPFITNNVQLMLTMLELARRLQPRLFLQISTDEVYGPAYGDERHEEWSVAVPSNPYSASKAAQEAIAIAYWRTYGVPLIITNSMNIVGETQDPEKFVPKLINAALRGSTVEIHASSRNGTPGSRFYLHARNQADALLFIHDFVDPKLYPDSTKPERLHVVGEQEIDNFELGTLIEEYVRWCEPDAKRIKLELTPYHASRPGHDLRYALDGARLAELGWKPPIKLNESLERTVRWTLRHREWLR